ncbi:MAG TPA: pyridoxamine 5'-phosphate oxidase family protein [Leptolyngbyaceae cyanobacterium]
MISRYHAGELAVQTRAGVQVEASRLSKMIGSSIQPVVQDFLSSQQMAIASTVAKDGQVWASLLTGKRSFVQAISAQTVRIDAIPVHGDPLRENLMLQDDIGILVIDLATRRRVRINGKAKLNPDGNIYVHTKQVYFNCPKYIQLRGLDTDTAESQTLSHQHTKTLTSEQQQWIVQTDTFFIGSYHPEGGADASHRGGYPGFVQVVSDRSLVFPDYAGNNMFNTLGNISVNPQIGLLFVNFERGSTLQLTGRANIVWDAERVAEIVGAERLVEFQIDQVLEIINAGPLRWRFGEYSPYNPV